MGKNFNVSEIDLLSSLARVQVPWVKVTIGDIYTFGVFDSQTRALVSDESKIYTKAFDIDYPNYIQSLRITKVNGQINRYTLAISYPVTQFDDPNFFEKVFSKASGGRKIVFSYGDISQPGFIYREEEAIITKITEGFALEASRIDYTIEAVTSASLSTTGSNSYTAPGEPVKPSDEIKKLFREDKSLQKLFSGMSCNDLDKFVAGKDKKVEIVSKDNISALDYLLYLVECMQPDDSEEDALTANYILTIHDNSANSNDDKPAGVDNLGGPFFKVSRIEKNVKQGDAYTLTVGYNTSTIVTAFSLENNENYALYYEYQDELQPKKYVRRLDNQGNWIDEYCPVVTTNTKTRKSTASDENWWNLITSYPINASITIMGLLRPATLMQYVRLHVVFPGGHKHISSGLYLVTKQEDSLDSSGYKTTLGLTRISGDEEGSNY
jgi:hypothetical protein